MVGKSNIRATNVNQDEDGVVRRMPLTLALLPPAQGKETTIAYEIARRAGAAPVEAGDLMVNSMAVTLTRFIPLPICLRAMIQISSSSISPTRSS